MKSILIGLALMGICVPAYARCCHETPDPYYNYKMYCETEECLIDHPTGQWYVPIISWKLAHCSNDRCRKEHPTNPWYEPVLSTDAK
jgi:hypothetical protein